MTKIILPFAWPLVLLLYYIQLFRKKPSRNFIECLFLVFMVVVLVNAQWLWVELLIAGII